MAVTSILPLSRREAEKQRQLVVTKRRASGLLLAAAALYLLVIALSDGDGWLGYMKALAEASMVGGLADWFAVTALFRHPLGIPIPHTAIIPERKDQFGQTLGDFVQQSFLTPENIVERVEAANVAGRAADWLVEPANAERLAGHLSDAAVAVADVVRDDDVHRVLEETVRRRIEALPLAPLAGRGLRMVTAENRHRELLDLLLRGLDRFLEENRETLRDRFGRESPWWLPEAVEDRLFERLVEGARQVVRDVSEDPNHELRGDFDDRLQRLIVDLETSPEMRRRGEDLKQELLAQPELRAWTAALWGEVKAELRAQADEPHSELRRRVAGAVRALGLRLRDDPVLRDRFQQAVESAARYVAEQFHDEIASLVSSTIERWDAAETTRRLELLLGADLQFIRMNGTIVGGLAGVAIHAFGQFFR
ncbi:MAG: DUF445 domain-containing protein [Acidimicrobiales bacterium]